MSETRRLGRYALVERLGQGGMGEVWLARLTGAAGFEKPYLLKSVLPRLSGDPHFLSRFQHEARVLVHLQHSNIAQVFDMGEADGALFMALEFVMGVDLARLHEAVVRAGQRLPIPLAVWLCQQAAEGLSYAHQKAAPDGTALAIVHRDVSPHNLMVSYDGELKVIDFGIARSAARTSHTQAQTVMGKIGYMAPEQARGEDLDARADQYALGIVLFELLTGAPYVAPGSVGEMMGRMANPRLKRAGDTRPEVPPQLEEVLQRALGPRPEDRFPRMADLAAALLQELARLGKIPTREEVGAFVRQQCAPAWEEHQQLMARLAQGQVAPSAAKSAPPPEPASEAAVTRPSKPARGPALDPTRAVPVAMPVAAADGPSSATAAVLATARPSRAPLAVVSALAVGLGAAALVLLSRTGAEPVQVAVADAGAAFPAVDAGAPLRLVLSGSARRLGSGQAWSLALTNESRVRWTDCAVYLQGRYKGRLDGLARGAHAELPALAFAADPAAPELNRKVQVSCAEGTGLFPLTK